jgi:hypothetical protein
MTTPRITTGTRRPQARRKTVRQFTPPQHGAWAMLLVPWLTGVLIAGFHWAHLPLLVAWIAGYLLSYYALQAIKTRRLSRVQPQLLLYGPITAALGLLVVTVRPQLLIYAPAYALLLALNVFYARAHHRRGHPMTSPPIQPVTSLGAGCRPTRAPVPVEGMDLKDPCCLEGIERHAQTRSNQRRRDHRAGRGGTGPRPGATGHRHHRVRAERRARRQTTHR